jgi:transcriptional regulator with XRE-family HTH domain
MMLTIKEGAARQAMVDRGLTARKTARLMQTDPGHLSRVLTGQSPLTWDFLLRLIGVLSSHPTTGQTEPVLPQSLAIIADVADLADVADDDEGEATEATETVGA